MRNIRIAIRPLASIECIISLAPTIAALKQKNPGASVGLIAEEVFREASHLLPALDFFSTDAEGLQVDHTIDLRGTEAFEGALENTSWKAYFQAAGALAHGNPFHQIDLLKKVAQVDTIDVNFELAPPEITQTLPDSLIEANGVRIAVCTSSLSAAEVGAALDGISQINYTAEIFLIGTVKDKRISSEIQKQWDGKLSVHDLCGHQGFSANAAALRNCDIAIVGPGVHALLSSGYGTFTICVDGTPARGPYLYPYGHGHLLLQSAVNHGVEENLSAMLKGIVDHALTANNGNVPTLDQWQEYAESLIGEYLGKVRLLATQRVEVLLKEQGSITELYQRPLLFTGSEIHDVFQAFYRLLWEHSIHERTITTYDLQILHQDTMPILCDLLKPLEQLYELGNFGKIYCGHVRESLVHGDLEKAQKESARLQEVEELVHALASTQPYFAPLAAYHRQKQNLMEVESALQLSDEMAALFTSLQNRVLVMLDLARSLFHTVFENESTLESTAGEEGQSNG